MDWRVYLDQKRWLYHWADGTRWRCGEPDGGRGRSVWIARPGLARATMVTPPLALLLSPMR